MKKLLAILLLLGGCSSPEPAPAECLDRVFALSYVRDGRCDKGAEMSVVQGAAEITILCTCPKKHVEKEPAMSSTEDKDRRRLLREALHSTAMKALVEADKIMTGNGSRQLNEEDANAVAALMKAASQVQGNLELGRDGYLRRARPEGSSHPSAHPG